MNPFRAHLERKSREVKNQKAHKRAVKRGLVVDRNLFPDFVVCLEYSDTRHDN